MPRELVWPSIVMSLAFVFYTLGVFGERSARDLLAWHLLAFWTGLACDAYGTSLMNAMVEAGKDPGIVHTISGGGAFALMAAHATWATAVSLWGSRAAKTTFHRYSLAVWLVWLVPYFGGMVAGITRGR